MRRKRARVRLLQHVLRVTSRRRVKERYRSATVHKIAGKHDVCMLHNSLSDTLGIRPRN